MTDLPGLARTFLALMKSPPRLMAALDSNLCPRGNGSRDTAIKRVFTWAEFAPSVSTGASGFIVRCRCLRPMVGLGSPRGDGLAARPGNRLKSSLDRKYPLLSCSSLA